MSERLRELYFKTEQLTEEEQLEKLHLQLKEEKKLEAKLPMNSFVDFELKLKLRKNYTLTESEKLRVIEGFKRLHTTYCQISEICVSESKEPNTSQKAIDEIRKVLQELC